MRKKEKEKNKINENNNQKKKTTSGFYERVYEITKQVPRGRVTTYKLIAQVLGTRAYRAVGNALNKNPYREVPCHRVIKSNGLVGGFARGTKEKIKLLKKEGVRVEDDKVINLKRVLFVPRALRRKRIRKNKK